MENQIEKNIEHLRNSQLFRGFTDDEIEKFLYNTNLIVVQYLMLNSINQFLFYTVQ